MNGVASVLVVRQKSFIRQRILEEGGRIYGNKPIYAPDLVDGMFSVDGMF